MRALTSDWDAIFVGNGHNGYLVHDPRDGKWELLPFDLDNSMGNANASFFPGGDTHVARFMARPGPRRVYFRILSEYVDGYWSSSTAGPWLDAVQRSTGVATASLKGYINTVASRVRSTVRSATTVSFRLLSGDGRVLVTEDQEVELEGEAPVQAAELMYAKNGGDPETLQPEWRTPTRWRHVFSVPEAETELQFFAFDGSGELLETVEFTVKSSAEPVAPTLTTLFPDTGPAAGGTKVTLFGSGYVGGMQVYFGGQEVAEVAVETPEVALVVTPPAPANVPADGRVDIEIVVSERARLLVPSAFAYALLRTFVRGDGDGDGTLNIGDPVSTLRYLFSGGSVACLDAADTNDDGRLDVSDPVQLLNYLFSSGPEPAAPFPDAGVDPTADDLDC